MAQEESTEESLEMGVAVEQAAKEARLAGETETSTVEAGLEESRASLEWDHQSVLEDCCRRARTTPQSV